MLTIISSELKKIFDFKVILAIACLVTYTIIMAFIWYGYYDNTTMTSQGETIDNISAYRVLKNETESVSGTVDTDYLHKLVNEYNASVEKNDMYEYLDTYMNRFMFTNYIFNYAGLGGRMNSGYMDLNYDFMKSEKAFERKYKDTLLTQIVEKSGDSHGIAYARQYSDFQTDVLYREIEKLNTNFKLGYNQGWYNIIVAYGQVFIVLLIVIAFSLSSIFSKDSSNGIEEIGLATRYGRSKNLNARLLAGNIFALIVYIIFLITLLCIHGSISTFVGWNNSIQSYWYVCYYNISFGVGILIMFFWGLLAVLIVANFVMMISIKTKYVLVSTIMSVIFVLLLKQLTVYENPIVLQLNPIFFATRLATSNLVLFDIPHFVGDIMVPYSVITILMSVFYILVFTFITQMSFTSYKI